MAQGYVMCIICYCSVHGVVSLVCTELASRMSKAPTSHITVAPVDISLVSTESRPSSHGSGKISRPTACRSCHYCLLLPVQESIVIM